MSALFQKYRASPDVGVPYSSSTYFMIFLTKYFTIFFLSYNWYNIENIGCQVSPIMKSNKLQRRCKNHFVAAPKRVNIAHCTLYILINVQNLKDHWVISWLCTFLRFCHSTTSRWVMNSSTLWYVTGNCTGSQGHISREIGQKSGESKVRQRCEFELQIHQQRNIFILGYTESLSFSFSPPPGWQDLLKKEDILTQQQSKSKTSQHEGINS